MRLPATVVLYAIPLLHAIHRAGYTGKLDAEPALVDGVWVLKVMYEGERPNSVPEVWHGRRVVLEEAKPPSGS